MVVLSHVLRHQSLMYELPFPFLSATPVHIRLDGSFVFQGLFSTIRRSFDCAVPTGCGVALNRGDQGVIVYFRIIDGEIRRGDKIKFMANGVEREVSRCLCYVSSLLKHYGSHAIGLSRCTCSPSFARRFWYYLRATVHYRGDSKTICTTPLLCPFLCSAFFRWLIEHAASGTHAIRMNRLRLST